MRGESEEEQFTQRQILKEETEAPFRQVRLFLYAALTASALIGLIVTGSKLAASASGIKNGDVADLATNFAIDAGGIAVIGALWRSDLASQRRRLQRIQKGGRLAGLRLKIEVEGEGPTVIKMADLRRGRGYSKRVVIVAANEALLRESFTSSLSESQSLISNDLLIVPVQIEAEEGGYKVSNFNLGSINPDSLRLDHIGQVSQPRPLDPSLTPLACVPTRLEHGAEERVIGGPFPADRCAEQGHHHHHQQERQGGHEAIRSAAMEQSRGRCQGESRCRLRHNEFVSEYDK